MLQASKSQLIFSQGDAADAVFYLRAGRVKLSVLSQQGKEAVVGILEQGSFFGKGCLVGQLTCRATATALDASTILRIDKTAMIRVLHDEANFAKLFIAHLLSHNVCIQNDLVDHLFNSTEKRLAQLLLLLAGYGKDGEPKGDIPKVSQETLAEMSGTTRSRVRVFLDKFRELGFIHYNGTIQVHRALLNIVLYD
jgi:CRP-like cAMP-binding protein